MMSSMNGARPVFSNPPAHIASVSTAAIPSIAGPSSSNSRKYGNASVPRVP